MTAEQIDVEDFKRAAGSFVTGVTVVAVRDDQGKLRGFTINVLSANQEWISRHFARMSADKFATIPYQLGVTGSANIEGCLASIDCTLETSYDGGDHEILIGRVRGVASGEGSPLLFHRSRYLRAL